MDANGQRFFLLADAADFEGAASDVVFDTKKRRLRLASTRIGPAPRAVATPRAEALLDRVPSALDAFGTYAWWDEAAGRVLASGALEEPEARETRRAVRSAPVPLFPRVDEAPLAIAPTDLCLGDGGVLALALGGAVTLVDLRERFAPAEIPFPGFSAWRLAAAEGFAFVALDRSARRLARLSGSPTASLPQATFAPGTFRPCRENPSPPTWSDLPSPAWEGGELPVAVAMARGGEVVVLSWLAEGRAQLRVLSPASSRWEGPFLLGAGITREGASAPATWAMSVAFVGEDRLAVLVPGLLVDGASASAGTSSGPRVSEALVFAWPLAPRPHGSSAAELLPLGDFYPLTDPLRGALSLERAAPLLRGPTGEAGYATSTGPRALAPLSKRASATTGKVDARILDAHAAGTTWHRVYVEAAIPEGTGVRLWLGADDGDPSGETELFPHDFGQVPSAAPGLAPADVPRAAFVHARSEIALEKGFLGCDPEPPRTGLFTVLVQRAGRAVRSLSGRRLRVRVELFGSGTLSPEIAAIRVYAPRFSYVDQYLPELYAETIFGPDGDAKQSATGSDFLGRLLSIVESELTPMEDRVAGAYLLSDARKTPDEALAWLSSWVGLSLDPSLSPARRRALLCIAPELARRHGTLEGLRMAIDAVSGGAVTRGAIVIVEDYRLRRVLATILGAHLEEQDDPLLPGGLIVSGNSYVGDTLFLGEGTREELVEIAALYRALPSEEAEDEAQGEESRDGLDDFYERFAHRATILVHHELTAQELGWIERAVALEAPAHVEARIVKARWPFLTGMASLVGVDSFLRAPEALSGFRLDESELGVRDVLERPASLDPRLESSSPEETP
jgi:phage tail-like protein